MKRTIALLITLVLIIMLSPMYVFADSTEKKANNTRYIVLILEKASDAHFYVNNKLEYTAASAIDDIKKASVKFVDSLTKNNENIHLAVVTYDTDVDVLSDFTTNVESLKNKINSIKVGSVGRNLSGAIDKADEMLKKNDVSTNFNDVVIVTTGFASAGTSYKNGYFNRNSVGSKWQQRDSDIYYYAYSNGAIEAAETLKKQGTVHVLGLLENLENDTEASDIATLSRNTAKAIATSENHYHEVTDIDSITVSFEEIGKTISKTYSVSRDGFSFSNFAGSFPVSKELFEKVYGSIDNNQKLQDLFETSQSMTKNGACDGMAISNALIYLNQPSASNWKASATCGADLTEELLDMQSPNTGFTLREFVLENQLRSKSERATQARLANNRDYNEMFEKIERFQKTGENPILMHLNYKNFWTLWEVQAHSLLPYKLVRDEKNKKVTIYVYDCNNNKINQEHKTIEFVLDDNGKVVSGEYNNICKWKYDGGNSASFSYTDVEIYSNETIKTDDNRALLVINTADFHIKTKSGESITSEDGYITESGQSDIMHVENSGDAQTVNSVPQLFYLDKDNQISVTTEKESAKVKFSTVDAAVGVNASKDADIKVSSSNETLNINYQSSEDSVKFIYDDPNTDEVIVEGEKAGSTANIEYDTNSHMLKTKGIEKVTVSFSNKKLDVKSGDVIDTKLFSVQNNYKYDDIPDNSWYTDAVYYVTAKGYMAGTGNNRFSPGSNVTRGTIAQILYAAEGKPEVSGKSNFSDVGEAKWYAKAVKWAADKGLVSGYGNGKFGPEDSITREQMVAIMMQYSKMKGYDTTANADLSKFRDQNTISKWAVNAVKWGVSHKIVSGTDKGIEPKGNASRAQIAVILQAYDRNLRQ